MFALIYLHLNAFWLSAQTIVYFLVGIQLLQSVLFVVLIAAVKSEKEIKCSLKLSVSLI